MQYTENDVYIRNASLDSVEIDFNLIQIISKQIYLTHK